MLRAKLLSWYHLSSRRNRRTLCLCNGSSVRAYCQFSPSAPGRPSRTPAANSHHPFALCRPGNPVLFPISAFSILFIMITDFRQKVNFFWENIRKNAAMPHPVRMRHRKIPQDSYTSSMIGESALDFGLTRALNLARESRISFRASAMEASVLRRASSTKALVTCLSSRTFSWA